jgi:hypothetical protein
MSLKKAAKNALAVQSAVNLSGVVRTMARDMDAVCDVADGTDAWNTHPVVKLYVTQLVHLAFGETVDHDQYTEAYNECKRLADEA